MATEREENLELLVEVMRHEIMMMMFACHSAKVRGERAARELAHNGEVEFDDLMEFSPFGEYDRALNDTFWRLFNLGLLAAGRLDELTSRTSETRGLSRDS